MTTSGPATGSGDHLSIGEVLAALHDEFPDITISKIRFLESQGLIDPERTPSGYRKFYADDVTRLRWILFQQKENFLPLKVIKDRLEELGPDDLLALEPTAADGTDDAAEPPAPVATAPLPEPPASRSAIRPSPAPRRVPAFAPTLPIDADDTAADASVAASAPELTGIEQLYGRDALCAAAGIDADQLASLEQYGLVTPARAVGDDVQFDADALLVAEVAAGFFARGVEARHLRMYHNFAEREAVLFGQVLMPYLRQRNPESRARLQAELVELAALGRRLRTVLLREAVRDNLSE